MYTCIPEAASIANCPNCGLVATYTGACPYCGERLHD